MQVSTYAFTFSDESQSGMQIRMLLPLLDLFNHGNEGVAASLHACLSWLLARQHLLAISPHLTAASAGWRYDGVLRRLKMGLLAQTRPT